VSDALEEGRKEQGEMMMQSWRALSQLSCVFIVAQRRPLVLLKLWVVTVLAHLAWSPS